MLNRREALKLSTCGIGSIALAGLCQQDTAAAPSYVSPLSPKQPHQAPRAKRMIFLHMRGGPSHMETFEIKPELNKRNTKRKADGAQAARHKFLDSRGNGRAGGSY